MFTPQHKLFRTGRVSAMDGRAKYMNTLHHIVHKKIVLGGIAAGLGGP